MRYIKTDWYQWHMTHTPVYWCNLTRTGYWYQKTGQCVWPLTVEDA